MSRIYLPPDGAMLNAHANANHRWSIVLGEWIDNAIDADARTIAIEFTKNSIRLVDDGHGCANPTDMIRLGSHTKHASTKIGRYGIGGKEAALWVGGLDSTIDICTVHAGRRRTLNVNWREYASKWEIDEPVEQAASKNDNGTVIDISPLSRKLPHGADWQDLLAHLGYLHSPALKHGHQIKFKRAVKNADWEPLVRWELPAFQGEIIDVRIAVNGRGARVYCGVVQQGVPNPHSGFTYMHKVRVIEPSSARGCGGYSSARVCGFVDLDSSWPLTKNKDGVSKDADGLYAEVERVAKPVLERADTIGTELRSQQFESEVADQLNALLAAQRAKARRAPRTTAGATIPTGTGGKHQRAAREQQGETFQSRRSGRFLIDFVPLGKPDSIGEVKPPSQVLLNIDNPMVAQVRRDNEATAVVILAASLISAEHCYAPLDQRQPLLRGIERGTTTSDFSKAIGTILSGVLSMDGKPTLKVVNG